MTEQPEHKSLFKRPLKKREIGLLFCGSLSFIVLLTPWDEYYRYRDSIIPLIIMLALTVLVVAIVKTVKNKNISVPMVLAIIHCRPLKNWEIALIFCGALAVIALLTPWDGCNKDQQDIMLTLLTVLSALAIAIAYKLAQGRYAIAIFLGMVATIVLFIYMVVCGPSAHQQFIQHSALEDAARVTKVTRDMESYSTALRRYQNDVQSKQYPATSLMQLVNDSATGWAGPYLATIINDPWNNQYNYISNGTTYTVQSAHQIYSPRTGTLSYTCTSRDTAIVIELFHERNDTSVRGARSRINEI